jgi:hypothetical protein
MKNFAIKCAAALALTSAAAAAFAQPSISTQVHSSGVIIRADNPDNKTYQCVVNYEFDYQNYGTRKSIRVSKSAPAHPGKSIIDETKGWYVDVTVPIGFDVSCN